MYELLAQKFQLFEGVFGASDEVLGTIGSGVDFERRIAEIYQTCRNPQQIETSFQQLQLDLSGEINAAMLKTRQLLLENFDETVQEKLKTRQHESTNARNRFERLLMDLTRAELQGNAQFDETGFTLARTPTGVSEDEAPPGRYELPRRSGEAHLYRTGHPLAQALIAQAREQALPYATLVFDYGLYHSKVSTLESLRGKSGQLAFQILSVEVLGSAEDHMLLAALTDDGEILHAEDPQKLMRLPARVEACDTPTMASTKLSDALNEQKRERLQDVALRGLKYFETEVLKLDAWSDDLKVGLERQIKELDKEIRATRSSSRMANSLDEKLDAQRKQLSLESKRHSLRRELFDKQDDVDRDRELLVDGLRARLDQKESVSTVFVIAWRIAL